MNDFTVVVVDADEIVITVTPEQPNIVIEVQDVAIPFLTNIDGGTAFSLYGGIPPIDGGGAE